MINGYDKLKESVVRDCVKGNNCFNENGCDKEYSKCMHRYCDKFKWVVDTSKHYGEKLSLPYEHILDSWEKDRDYWYMNYYQESNQPKISSENVRVFDSVPEFIKSVGKFGFRCPKCGIITMDAYKCDDEKCSWKSYGLFGCIGKGVFVFCKDKLKGETIFMPIAWEKI